MALYYSTALRNALLGLQGSIIHAGRSTNFAYVDGGESADTITDSGSTFITTGFYEGMKIWTYGSSDTGNNLAGVELTEVTQGTLTFATGTVNSAEAFLTTTDLIGAKGGSLRDLFAGGCIEIYSGSIPATADAAITGSLVCRITLASGAWTAGSPVNGLFFGAASAGAISKASGTWSGVGLISPSATMTHFRLKGNVSDANGADTTTYYRIQGTVGVGTSYNLNVTSTTLALGATLTIDTCTFTPAAYV
jgi:prepilin-type processing-associated H-X9-DG protein